MGKDVLFSTLGVDCPYCGCDRRAIDDGDKDAKINSLEAEVVRLRAALDIAGQGDISMSPDRVRWEHIQRVYELCGKNVSETARRLTMHRRTLQRILARRLPKEPTS